MPENPARFPDGRLRPLGLPHLDPEPAEFLREPLPPDVFGTADANLWRRCDGRRPLDAFSEQERARILLWHRSGLAVLIGEAKTTYLARGGAWPVTVLSPHPDDATLAVGGLLHAHGGRVIDVFTYETWTRRPAYRARPELTAELLCREEAVACRVLGVDHVLLGFRDGELRQPWRTGYLLPDADAVVPAAVEPDLFAEVVRDIAAGLPDAGPVLAPLAVGGHVDHVLVRDAALDLVARGRLDRRRLHFYEDMPYSLFANPAAVAAELGRRRGLAPLVPRSTVLPDGCAAVKREALRAYRLQVPTGLAERVVRYGRVKAGGEIDGTPRYAERTWSAPDAWWSPPTG